MNKNSKLVSVILSAVALVLFVVSFILTKAVEESEAVVTGKETSIILVGAIVSLGGLIINLLDNHKLIKLLPLISYAVFAIYMSQFAEDYLAAGYGASDPVFNYPVLNFLAVILFAVSAVFMVKDGYKWAKVVFVTAASYLTIVTVTATMGYYFLYDYEGALYVSLYVIATSVLMISTLVAGLISFLPETEAKEEAKVEEAKEEVAEENVEATEEVAEDTKDEEVKEEAPAQENNDAEESSKDEVKLDFGDNN
ncbi:MAG: hypothetical protein K5892_02240 [Acholeplasmatales bacterium]|nr:hypothetical protein [Acholeplasmatales bacterium]